MDYKAEDAEDKKYKKGYGRKEFKKDVADAVEPVLKKGKKPRKKKGKLPPQFANQEAAPVKKKSRSAYAKMSTKELRKLLTDKKKALLKKSGFPESGLPRSKEEMINLCVRLKRKRW